MKIKPEHLDYMRKEIARVAITPETLVAYETGNFPRSEKTKDLQTRFNFDVMNAAGLNKWICDNVYPYANDDHVATALRAICPTVTRRY